MIAVDGLAKFAVLSFSWFVKEAECIGSSAYSHIDRQGFVKTVKTETDVLGEFSLKRKRGVEPYVSI
jgi:hypothetical protein